MTLDPTEELHPEISELKNRGTCVRCDMKTSEHSNASNRTSANRVSLTSIVVIVMIGVILIPTEVRGMPRSLLCDSNARCLHGGVLRLPDTPFGFCRCMCRDKYVGPRCQFSRLGYRRVNNSRRENRFKRLVRLKKQFRDWLITINSSER